ncbi:MAG: hypothetical protein IKI70_02135 [Bacteroidales bacterium]|nr:hypothetical protein [Bacteroidales bacterium]
MEQEEKQKQIRHIKLFAWLWLVVGVAGLVLLVSRVLDVSSTAPMLKRALLPGVMFVIGLIGTIQNKKVLDRLEKE